MKRILLTIMAFLAFCSSSYAIPVYYSLNGTAVVSDPNNNTTLYDRISGIMVLNSVPQYATASDPLILSWMINSISITSDILKFNGSGEMHLFGSPDGGIYEYNESQIDGYGSSPFYSGELFSWSPGPNFFYNEDGTPVDDTSFAEYAAGLPYIIAPGTTPTGAPYGSWLFTKTSNDFSIFYQIDNFSATRIASSAPVPEPPTLMLISLGVIGIVGLVGKQKISLKKAF